MQGLSASSLSASGNTGSCAAVCLLKANGRPCHLHAARPSSSLLTGKRASILLGKNLLGSRKVALTMNAAWFGGSTGKRVDASCERSESADDDILMFFLQLDIETRIQYALNVEQFEVAKELRNRLTQIELEIVKQREAKRGSSKSEAQDKALSLLRLRADLQKAIDSEDYAAASVLRDDISKLESESLAASAKALAFENVEYLFRLGQKVKHTIFGYEAVVCGMDPVCCESSSWMEVAQVDKLARGPNQPFYQVLVDVRTDPNLLVAYVPEEKLLACNQSQMGSQFDHPYLSVLFYGMDSAGDFIPVKQLRERYNRPRYEVPLDTQNGDDGKND